MKSPLQLAALEKAQAYRTPDPERRAEASRALAEAKIAACIDKALSASAPLSNQQIHRLTSLLRDRGQQ